jgi:polyferredoxin
MRTSKKMTKNLSVMKVHKKLVFTIFATVGVVAVWRGIWVFFDALPYFDKPLVAGGFAILVIVVGVLYFKQTEF